MKKQFYLAVLFLLGTCSLWAQQSYPVTDTQPVQVDGLTAGYSIKSEEVKAVSDKGDFSRFSLRFYVTNPGGQAKIMLYKQGLNLLNNVSDQLGQFNCMNATGARLTSKTVAIAAPACNVLALVDDKDPANGKIVKNKRLVQIGYWIRAGETITADVIMIVPLHEKPNVQFAYLANMVQDNAATMTPGERSSTSGVLPSPGDANGQAYARIRSMFNSTYINVETGPVRSTAISGDRTSAQWQVIPVPGTSYFNIRNRFMLSYLNISQDNVGLSPNFQRAPSMWEMEATADPKIFRLKNVETRRYLCIVGDQLTSAMSPGVGFNSSWTAEQLNH